MNEQPRLATECFGLPSGSAFADGSTNEPDVIGYSDDEMASALIEVKTGKSLFNWTDGRDQLTRYRETYDVGSIRNRVLVMPGLRAEKIKDGFGRTGESGNVPAREIAENWRIVTWEDIARWLYRCVEEDARVLPMLAVSRVMIRAR